MLNISRNSVADKIDRRAFSSLRIFLDETSDYKRRNRIIAILGGIVIAFFFLPWTQNIQGRGYVTSLQPEKRPQTLQSVIGGRIEQWYVAEGDSVARGDTLLRISEIKDAYFDPQLISRTEKQVAAKKSAVVNYREKANALAQQIEALQESQVMKTTQAENKLIMAQLKVTADSIDLVAARTNEGIAQAQFDRMEELFKDGLYSKTDLETRRMKLQSAQAKRISQESKLLSSRNDLINAQVEINSVGADFRNKLSKARSERFATLSALYDAEAMVQKLENTLSNYRVRTSNYFILAPQSGFITRALKTGIGETVKEGERIVTIMPSEYELAVEMYIRPLDLPLMHLDEEIRIQFDGWPAIFFSGWPSVATGTFSGRVVAIDRFTSDNGQYRVLVSPGGEEGLWPRELRVGSGAKTFALLNDVPVWYEIWRRINGFPPDYYLPQEADQNETKLPGKGVQL